MKKRKTTAITAILTVGIASMAPVALMKSDMEKFVTGADIHKESPVSGAIPRHLIKAISDVSETSLFATSSEVQWLRK